MSKARIEGFEKQRDILISLMYANGPSGVGSINYDGMPKGSKNYMSLDRIVERINRIDNQLYIEHNLLQGMEKTKAKIEKQIKGLKGKEYRIAYKRIIEGKTLQEIADELGYSLGYIRNLSMKMHKGGLNGESTGI